MKKLYRLTITYADVAFLDKFFEDFKDAYNYGMRFIDDCIDSDPDNMDNYECIIYPTEGVVL